MRRQTNSQLLALYSDFGDGSAYVAMLKGRLLSLFPRFQITDVSHRLPSEPIFETALLLRRVYSYYPAGTIHLVGVDPGAGWRQVLIASAAGQTFLAADNGALGLMLEQQAASVWAAPIAQPTTFVARDVLASLAAELAQDTSPDQLGHPCTDFEPLALPRPRRLPSGWEGEVIHVDGFGNLLTNFTSLDLLDARPAAELGATTVTRWAQGLHTDAAAEPFLFWGAEG
ncbi:MAG: SAM hydrolase/SAM-dependent halogenase family protein, partial [Terriglobales bacterium]